MPKELSLDYLIVVGRLEPPAPTEVSRALAVARLGAFEYTAAARPDGAPSTGGRVRLGTYAATVPEIQGTARLLVARYDEAVTAGMGEAAFAQLALGLEAAAVRTLREGALALDLRFSAPEERGRMALGWATRVVRVLVDLSLGVCIDPAAQRALAQGGLARLSADDPLAHVAFHDEAWDPESRWLHTHGLQKLGRPELELVAVPISLQPEAEALLREVAGSLAGGAHLAAGGEIDLDDQGALVAVASVPDADHQAPYGRLVLADAPLPGEDQGLRATRLLGAMALASSARRAASGDLSGAFDDVERVLAADTEDGAALLAKTELLLRSGAIAEALDLGELMELRAPMDYRGPLVVGRALAALGRYREALHTLTRALDLEPEAIDVYAARAGVYERLGERPLAATDRTHAAYLARAGR
jgi:tetratricopeptide (TPR) repeat protein